MTETRPDTNAPEPRANEHPSATQRRAARAAVGPVSRWAIHRRLYDWVLSFAHHRHATTALFTFSFAESSVFPVPPDVLLGPLCLGHRRKALWFAAVTTLGSVLGAVLGYAIGWGAWELTREFWFAWVPKFSAEDFDDVQGLYAQWGAWILFAAAFTPIPFKVFTVAGGVMGQALIPFLIASTIGRGLRFFLVAGLFWWIGPRALPFIDRYFNWLCIAFVALLIGGFAILRLLN